MVEEGRAKYADPSSLLRAAAMMLEHIGFTDRGSRLHMALEICGQYERKISITGRDNGASGEEFGAYILATVDDPNIAQRWQEYVEAEV